MNSSDLPIVECRGVEKRYYYYTHRARTMRDGFIRTLTGRGPRDPGPEFRLSSFDLQVRRGEVVAFIGHNGSGKSTLLRLIGGIYLPTEGEIHVRGRIAAVMELGAGFHEDLTGGENVALYGAIMGMTPAEMAERRAGILEFAGLGGFIDTPVRYYSSGMQARLAFAVALSVGPDVVLLDEVLAVGDEEFRERCLGRLDRYHADGGTILLVSHDLDEVASRADRAVWMEHGRCLEIGPAADVVARYRAASHADGD